MLNFLLWFFVCFFVFYLCLTFYTARYANPYKIIILFGKKGVGKSTDIVKRSLYYQKRGWRCFCNDPDIKTCEPYPSEDFGSFAEPHSVIFLDEAGLVFHKRDFADKSKANSLKNAREFSKLVRHNKMICFIYSQSWDIDLSLKENCDYMYYMRKFMNVFTVGRRVNKDIVFTKPEADRPGMMADTYVFESIFSKGGLFINFIPKYSKYYNSFNQTFLPSYDEKYHKPHPAGNLVSPQDADCG